MGKSNNQKGIGELIFGSSTPGTHKKTNNSGQRRDNTPERATHEGAKQKIANALEGRGWDNAKKGRFHGYLTRNYRDTKNSLSQSELNGIANEFDRQDNSNHNNSRGRR